MEKSVKIIIAAMVIVTTITIVFFALGDKKDTESQGKFNIVTTTFSTYDFTRQIVGDKATITYLLGPRNRCT